MRTTFLDTKIPPPIVFLFFAVLMYFLAKLDSNISIPVSSHVRYAITGIWVVLGLCLGIAGVLAFKLAKTTVNPLQVDAASTLVTSGVFQYTRNPMYLGLVSILVGWTAYLMSPLSLIGVLCFVLYMNHFQIKAEESAMLKLFGNQYQSYKAKVRRWF